METLVLPFLNLAVLLGFLTYKLKKPLSEFIVKRHKETIDGLNRTKKQVADAELRRAEIENKLAKLDTEKTLIAREWKDRGELQIKALRESSQRVLQQMNAEAQRNQAALSEMAQSEILKSAGKQAIFMATEKLKAKLTPEAQQQVQNRFAKELAGA